MLKGILCLILPFIAASVFAEPPQELNGRTYDTNSLQNVSYDVKVAITGATKASRDDCAGEYYEDYDAEGSIMVGTETYKIIEFCFGEILNVPEYLAIHAVYEFPTGFKKEIWLTGEIKDEGGKKILKGNFVVGSARYHSELEVTK